MTSTVVGGTSSRGWEIAAAPAAPWLEASYQGYTEWSQTPVARSEAAAPRVVLIVGLGGPLRVGDAEVRSFVAGLTQRPTLTEFTERQCGVELRLTPLGAYRLFGVPMSELTDQVVDLDALWGTSAARLAERLAEAPGWAERFALLDGELTRLADRGPSPDAELEGAWRRLADSAGRLRIRELLDDTGWSRRRLAERFRRQTGLTPKALARLLRFEHATGLLLGSGHRSLSSVALACGYYDQAHLNRDFRELAGCTPTEYVRSRGLQ